MSRRKYQSGQAIVMITLALMAMAGLMGLAVDLGWSFYVHKTARMAADGAAMAGIKDMFNAIETSALIPQKGGPYSCGQGNGTIVCQTLTPCSSLTGSGPLVTACNYAQANGFSNGGHGGRQNLQIESGVGNPPSAPGVSAMYWIHVVTAETIPQLFSSLLGNTNGIASSDATGAIIHQVVNTTLVLLNKSTDPAIPKHNGPQPGNGTDLFMQGSGSVVAPSGISLASTASKAGDANGGSTVTAPFTQIAGSGAANWSPTTGVPASSNIFNDPEAGQGQPPLNSNGNTLNLIGVQNGNFNTVTGCPNACPQGLYYYFSGATGQADGTQLNPSGMTFQDPNTNFGTYIFAGGMKVPGTVTFGPGQYVMAGVATNSNNNVFDVSGSIIGGTAATSLGSAGDAGRMVIFTDGNYQAYSGDTTLPNLISQIPNKVVTGAGLKFPLQYADASFQCGNCTNTIYGLNPASANLPSALQAFSPFVMWQDQQNSQIQYDVNGNIVMCGAAACTTSLPPSWLTLWGGNSASAGLYGSVYMPRGSYIDLHSAISMSGTVQLIGGGINMQGSPTLTLTTPATPATKLTVSLVR